VRDGRIACVGRDEEVLRAAGHGTRTIDLGGRTLVPGFNDAHAHIWKIGQLLTSMLDLCRNFRRYLPDSLLPRTYPVRAMLDAGVRVALSSDAPVVEDDNPLVGMMAAITRLDSEGCPMAPAQAITAEEALYAYTMGGAIASGDEANRGSIEAGKWADLAVLSGNPLTVPPEALPELKVDMTLVAGRVLFER